MPVACRYRDGVTKAKQPAKGEARVKGREARQLKGTDDLKWTMAVKNMWTKITGVGFLVLAALHLLVGLFIVLVYGAKGGPLSVSGFLPLFDRLGKFGYVLFFISIVLDAITGLSFLKRGAEHRRNASALTTFVLNLPLVPLGTIMGIVGLLVALVPTPNRS